LFFVRPFGACPRDIAFFWFGKSTDRDSKLTLLNKLDEGADKYALFDLFSYLRILL